MLHVIQQIMNLGAVVMLPIVMFILGLIFRMKIGKALKAGLMVGIGFSGLQLVINLLMTTVDPAIQHYKGIDSSRFTTVDVGWAAMGAASWSVPFAAAAVLLIVVINIVLILTKATKVLNVDIWNFIHFLIPGTLAYAITHNAIIGLVVTVGLSVITLFVAQKIGPRWQEFYGLKGTTCTTFSYITFALPLAIGFNWLIDRIPKVRDIDISMEKTGERLGFFGDTAFVGLIVGVFLGLITRQSWQTTLTMGMGIAAVLVLLPRMVSVMMEGLTIIGDGASDFMKRRVKDDRELFIGMDVALSLGDPTAITVSVILIPLAIAYAFIIPNMAYFPVGLLTGIVYMVPFFSLASKGNLFRTLISSAIFLFIVEVLANLFAPQATAMMNATGVKITGQVTDGFFGYNLANVVISALHMIFG
ncbi:MAG: PTS transporter subunit IIC [Propionibacterium sp.]